MPNLSARVRFDAAILECITACISGLVGVEILKPTVIDVGQEAFNVFKEMYPGVDPVDLMLEKDE